MSTDLLQITPECDYLDMAIRNEDLPKIDERIKLALAPILSEIKSLRPQGWRKIIFWLREAGILAAVIGAFVGLLAITVASIYRAVTDVREEATFRANTVDRLGNIETQLLRMRASQSPNAVLKQINELDPKMFAKALPALRKVVEQPVAEVNATQPTLQQIAGKLRQADESSPDYWSTVLQFIQFASSVMTPLTDVPPPGPPESIMSNVRCSTYGSLCIVDSHERILFDGGDIEHSRFENCRITFTQTPVKMRNVQFINCVFEMPVTNSPTPYLKDAARQLLASNLTSVSIPSS